MKHTLNTYAVLSDHKTDAQSALHLKRLAAMPVRKWKTRERQAFLAQFYADRRALSSVYKQLSSDRLLSADFYMVEKALTMSDELKESCGADLSADAYGEGMGMPRIYHVAALMSAQPLHDAAISELLQAYQSVCPLTMRELWCLNDMLRVALLKRIRILLEKMLCKRESHTYHALQRCITDLRYLELWDAESSFETYSVVEQLLTRDAVYADMDAPSRSFYRGRVALLAKKLNIAEPVVAENALYLCEGRSSYQAHVGYYLVDAGEKELCRQLRPDKTIRETNNAEKLGLLIAGQLIFSSGLLWLMWENAWSLLLLFPAWAVANTLILRLFMRFSRQRFLPRLRAQEAVGVLVVIPSLLAREGNLENAIRQMETHYLANPLPHATFAVLGDFCDAKSAELNEKEAEIVRQAIRETERLNQKYAQEEPIFFFLIRKRSYHAPDDLYMGRERKRGALEDLMRLLAKGEGEPFLLQSGEMPPIEYVLTMDEDTILPRETLQCFVGAVRHPLNQPVYDEQNRRERGYGVLFPVMRNTASGAAQNAFARIMAGDPGVESYRASICEFYMDVFGNGIFGGKGIWRVDSYLAVSEKIPPNSVLCHDLLEGSMAGAGLLEDVALYDTEMASCLAWWKRLHRWIRGDWQLLPFLKKASSITRYQILENIRRSLLPLSKLLMVFALPFMGAAYALAAFFLLFFDALWDTANVLFAKRRDMKGLLIEHEPLLRRTLLEIMLLPYAAWRSLDAIVRSVYRMAYSHKHMLEWQTAAQQNGIKFCRFIDYAKAYYLCPLTGAFLLFLGRNSWYATFIALLWLFAPLCIRGLEAKKLKALPSQADRSLLMDIAMRTWQFFETYANEKTGFLPPDNVQESPQKSPVLRTSPTNIGLCAVSCVAAYDLGFIDSGELYKRLSGMADSLEKLDDWHGHLFNWYDLSSMQPCVPSYVSSVDSGNFVCAMLAAAQAAASAKQAELSKRLRALAVKADFRCLYDEKARLFYIGYDSHNGSFSPSRYDLLASEARLLSFVAIALNQVEQRHWFSLGRLLTPDRVLISWSGTMFEYLMPVLFTGLTKDTLLYRSCMGAVQVQCENAEKGGVWGISESAYYAFDRRLYYQYAPFGVRELALCDKDEEAVFAPYATLLALMCEPSKAIKNIERLKALGALGEYGLYEAIDFEQTRTGNDHRIVKSYMAHHQGMGLCAIADLLRDASIKRRFMQVPEVHAARLLLEEKSPLSVRIKALHRKEKIVPIRELPPRSGKQKLYPETQLLTNGQYTAFISEDGGGYSRFGNIMLSRWKTSQDEDTMTNGIRVYVATQEDAWELNGIGAEAGSYFLPHEVVFEKTQNETGSRMRICVSAQHNGEIREIRITNHANENRNFSLGVFFEPSLCTKMQDAAHPAFQKLRIDAVCEENILLFQRRNTPEEKPVWLFCLLDGVKARYCSDALIMPGRGRSQLEAMKEPLPDVPISSPIEPLCHIRAEFTLSSGDAQQCRLIFGCVVDRETALHDAFVLREENPWEYARAQAKSSLYFSNIERGKADLFEKLAGRLILRQPYKNNLPDAKGGVASLWALGISGDDPIVLLRAAQWTHLRTARLLAAFEAYYSARGENCDVVIIGDYPNAYRNELKEELEKLRSSHVYVFNRYNLDANAVAILHALCFIDMDMQTLEACLQNAKPRKQAALNAALAHTDDFAVKRPLGISADNGFDPSDHSYVVLLGAHKQTPLPWCNIMCNESFGTLISERGGGYTWAGNSKLAKLTPWYNDPLTDRQGERLIITDEQTGESWNPLRDASPLCIRHGFGYSSFVSGARAIYMRMTVFVHNSLARKYTLVELENPLMRNRTLNIAYQTQWLLGDVPHTEAVRSEKQGGTLSVINMREEQSACLLVSPETKMRVLCGAAEENTSLSFSVKLAAGEKKELLFTLCSGKALGEYPSCEQAKAELRAVKQKWKERFDALSVNTGESELDAMLNAWLPYQTECSRLMARTGYYQCGGAIGFRDQLQDTLSLKLVAPERLKSQLLLCSGVQFEAGDVLHWWHPGEGKVRGVRTHIRDDRLFLPYALLEYLDTTGDMEILESEQPYLEDVPLKAGQKDLYCDMQSSERSATLYEHCKKAIESMDFGAHGLCLMGGGDWNDAMDLVGKDGGESAWLSFFLLCILERFSLLSAQLGDSEYAKTCKERALSLREACEAQWDGAWYRRAYFSDGTPLGTRDGEACAIDCITQAWAVLAGVSHAAEAFDSMLGMLLDEQAGILKLLSPPFSPKDRHQAGYIQAYLPGVRENGGQYTHGACWAVMAACALGKTEIAEKLFRMLLPISHTSTPQGQ